MKKSILALTLALISSVSLSGQTVSAASEAALELVQQEYVYEPGPFPSCHASTIVETTQGELLAAFFGGTREGDPDVCIWLSRRTPEGWSAPVKVADGVVDSVKTACYNPVLFQIPDGDLLLFYKVGENVRAWNGYLIRSSDGLIHVVYTDRRTRIRHAVIRVTEH